MDIKDAKIFGFELVDVINALIDVPPKAQYATMRVSDGGEYLEIEFVGPEVHGHAPDIGDVPSVADEFRETARELRMNANGDPSQIKQAMHFEKKAEALENEKATELPAESDEAPPTENEPSDTPETRPDPAPDREQGDFEQKAYALCAKGSFQMFFGVETEEEAIVKLKEATNAKDFRQFDDKKERYKIAAFHDVTASFDAWLRGEE